MRAIMVIYTKGDKTQLANTLIKRQHLNTFEGENWFCYE
jgi:hypothetical protein